MSKRECDIIKDLLPSYVDEICSEASKEWIEEHLKECEECRKTVSMLRDTEISAKKLEQEQLEAGRKVIRQNLKRSLFSFGLSALMFVVLFCSFFWDNGQIPILLLPVCMAMTWLVARNQNRVRGWDKWDGISLVVSVVAMCYGVGMVLIGFSKVAAGNTIFGRELTETGPFLSAQVLGVIVVCAVVYFWQIIRILKHGRNGSVLLNLSLTGIFLMLSYLVQFGQLVDVATARSGFYSVTAIVLILGAVGILVFAFMDNPVKKLYKVE